MSNHGTDEPQYDGVAARLRAALKSEAAMVEPAGDGLQKIRLGIEARRRPWWQHPGAVLAAAAVAGLAVGGVAFALGGDDGGPTIAATSSPSVSNPSDQPSPTDSPSASQSGDHEVTDTVYVYYVHDDGQSPRLYREEHTVTAAGGSPGAISKADLGVFALLNQEPDDPDYASPWPDGVGIIDGVTKDGDTATVDLTQFMKQGSEVEAAGVQALVYTVTANDPSVKKVRVLVQGKAPRGHSDWSQPIARAPMLDVQGLIWLLSPEQGETVSSPVTINGVGTAFEGTISWEVRKAGEVVKEGFTQGGSGEFSEFTDTVELPAGDYEITAFESSAEDGSPIHIDTKNFTVK